MEKENKIIKNKWASDASQVDVSKMNLLTYRTNEIKKFIEDQNTYFIAANKGMGKTMVLSLKRKEIADYYSDHGSISVKFIPENDPYLDFSDDIIERGKEFNDFLSDNLKVKSLWKTSLVISILSHVDTELSDIELERLREDQVPKIIAEWIVKKKKIRPSIVFNEMIHGGMSLSKLQRFIQTSNSILNNKIEDIHSRVYVFIDKVDQAIDSLPKECWITIQAGLLEAIWDIVSGNNHIKIYSSIRKEAFGNFTASIRANIFNHSVRLKYDKEDLISIMDKLSAVYEKVSSFKDFININEVKSSFHQKRERPIDYIDRHTVGRPRDFVIFAEAISNSSKLIDSSRLKTIVTETAEEIILNDLFEESKKFLDSLENHNERVRFYELIPENILSKKDLYKLSYRFNRYDLNAMPKEYNNDDLQSHPFSELYKIGFLGVIQSNEDKEVIRFKLPGEKVDYDAIKVPDSPYYFIHPIISYYLNKQNSRKHRIFKNIVVGDHYPWSIFLERLYKIQSIMGKIKDAQLINLIDNFIDKHFDDLNNLSEEPKLSREWEELSKYLESKSENKQILDIYFLLDKLCKQMR